MRVRVKNMNRNNNHDTAGGSSMILSLTKHTYMVLAAATVLILSNNRSQSSFLVQSFAPPHPRSPVDRRDALVTREPVDIDKIVRPIKVKRKSRRRRRDMIRLRMSNSGNKISSLRSKLLNFIRGRNSGEEKSTESMIPTTSMQSLNTPPIVTKPRPVVSLSSETGLYVRPDISSPDTSSSPSTSDEDTSRPGFFNLKDVIYNTMDTVGKLSSSVRLLSPRKIESNSINGRVIDVGYGNTVEKSETTKLSPLAKLTLKNNNIDITQSSQLPTNLPSGETPGAKLLRQYEVSLQNSKVGRPDPTEDLFRSEARKAFDFAKDGFYSVLDVLSGLSDSSSSSKSSTSVPMLSSFKPVAKTSLNNDKFIANTKSLLPELTSSDPVDRFKAKVSLSSIENNQRRREVELKQLNFFDQTKEAAYKTLDTATSVGKAVATLPSQIQKTIEATQGAVEGTIEGVQSLPLKIEQTVKGIQTSVQDTKRASEQVIEDVRSIPKVVETKVEETQKGITETRQAVLNIPQKVENKIEETQKSVKKVLDTVDSVTHEAKVLAGVEKRKPKPPPPPPLKTKTDIAWDIAGMAAGTAGKVAWTVGKGTIGLVGSGAKLAFSTLASKQEEKRIENKGTRPSVRLDSSSKVVTTDRKNVRNGTNVGKALEKLKAPMSERKTPQKPPSLPNTISRSDLIGMDLDVDDEVKMSLTDIDADLDREVSDALRLAEEAVASVEKEKPKEKELVIKDITAAVRRAKEAAASAAKDAAELEALVRRRF